jgi:prepilin-type N-terminal cleavage/methylation domain-containing protein
VSTRRTVPTGDAGVTLLEVVVAMSIMSMVMAAFTTGVIAMYRSANRTEAISTAQSQVATAFARLDRELRYATAISEPGTAGSDRYVEYLTITTSGVPTCNELRLDTTSRAGARLRLRSWSQGSQPPPWSTSSVLAAYLGTDQPFQSADTANVQRLRVVLQIAGSTAPAEATFTALNSASAGTPDDKAVCTEGRAAP